ncbi:restriction endonuclease subunit S [Corynebacterium pseudodiphtheriticum]|uniref:restriction endonuclease subunit S n=1 Tax=Corynebacterium pseudodiphtheriticum TaxID=37637 RepID=UPI00254BB4AC|nr:restriction endonuclease subunit S [Corynebacterium pseudodiphtheriticum]MDK8545333.1 restriction endonuclease subunit S [Corynebacterium pseudodiphtheriticum]
MSRVDDLIKKLCPNGVEFKRIGDLAVVGTGSSDRKDASLDGPYPFYVRSKQLMKHDNFEFDETAIIIPGEGNIGEVFHYQTGKYALHQRAYRIAFTTDSVLTKFAFYYFAANFKNFILKKAVSATVTSIRKPMVTDFEIPVPPLEIQQEIARILDKFTQLEAELEAELEARRKQYSFYKNALFSFGDDVKFHELGDICESITAGGDRPKRYCKGQTEPTDEFPYPIYSNGTGNTALYGYTDQFKISEPAVTISARGTIGAHSVRSACFTPIVRLLVLIPDSKLIDLKFLNHVLDVTEIGYSGGSIPQLTVPKVKRLRIPLPPLEEQRRIVAILDKFDALVNDISTGLPAEIAARRKQYEYYRDKLLSFDPV